MQQPQDTVFRATAVSFDMAPAALKSGPVVLDVTLLAHIAGGTSGPHDNWATSGGSTASVTVPTSTGPHDNW